MARAELNLKNEGFVSEKFYGRLQIENAWTYYVFNKHARVQKLLHKMKYHNMPELAEMVGERLGLALMNLEISPRPDVIIPVPLHKSKLRRRGYNQSEYFAKGLAKHLIDAEVSNGLIRKKNTETQTRKSRLNRWQNVNEIFEMKAGEALKGKNVLLVDDVITTGATIEACGQVLVQEHLKSLTVASMAAAK